MPTRSIWYLAFGETLLWSGLYYLFPALLLHWEAEQGWHRSELTFAFTLSLLVSAVCAPLAGRIIDRGHGPWLLPGSAFAGGLTLALLPLASSLTWFYILWILIGLFSSGCLYEACFTFVVRQAGSGAQRAITHISLVAGFAGTLCFPAARGLARTFHADIAIWAFATAILFLAAPLLWAALQSCPLSEDTTPVPPKSHTRLPALRRPLFWCLAAAFSLFVTNHIAVLNHLLPILEAWNLPPETGILAVAMIGPMQVLGRLLWMAFDRHLSVGRVAVFCFLGINLATLLLLSSRGAPQLLAAFVVLQGASYGLICIVRPLLVKEKLGETEFGAVNGALAMPYLLCTAAAPTLTSLLWQWKGYETALWVIWSLSMTGLMFLLISLRLTEKNQASNSISTKVRV